MNATVSDRLVARAVRGGYNAADARRVLAELVRALSAPNLPYALAYHGFSTARSAQRDADALVMNEYRWDAYGHHLYELREDDQGRNYYPHVGVFPRARTMDAAVAQYKSVEGEG
jgi:hypothetical protein